jgi:hypothetical protein
MGPGRAAWAAGLRSVAAGGVALALSVPAAGVASADAGLVLSPANGSVGDSVVGRQDVRDCALFTLHWQDESGPVLGTDDGGDGVGSVTFRVPAGASGPHTVVATCRRLESPGGEGIVAEAAFDVTLAGPTSTVSTTLPQATTRPQATTPPTTRPPATTPPSTAGGVVGSAPASPSSSRAVTTTVGRPATTTAPSTTVKPAAGGTAAQDIAECERQAREARSQLVYQPNQRMTVGGTYDVVVQLALTAADLPAVVVPGTARTTIVEVRTARCTVEAELLGGTVFSISPPGPRAQSFVDSRVLTWHWQVSPRQIGPGLKLLLRLQPTVVEDGKPPRPGSDDFHEAVIQVDSQPVSLISRVDRDVNGFVGNNVVKLLLLPSSGGLLTFWAGARFRRRTKAARQAA